MLRSMRPRWFLVLLLPLALLAFLFWRGAGEPFAPPPEQPAQPEAPSSAREPDAEVLEAGAEGEGSRSAEAPGAASPGEADEMSGATEIVAEIDEKSAPVVLHGTLRDETTHLALPDFRLEFEIVGDAQVPNRRAQAVTDAKGEFRCEEPLAVARALVRFVDRAGRKRAPPPWTLELEDVRKGELELSIPCGPTYFVSASPREVDLAAVDVRMVTRDPRARGKGPNVGEWEPVRAGEKPWVRFAPVRSGENVERLEARSRDGLGWAVAEARVASGIAPGVTLLSFEARAVLDGRVVDGEQHALADVDVRLDANDAAGTPVRRSARTDAEGRFRFEHLAPCAGRLRASSLRHVPFETGVTLLAGLETKSELVLAPLSVAGAIRVRVESESGQYDPPFSLRLTLEDDPAAAAGSERFERRVPARWALEDGRKVARFEFPQLPARSYRLQVEKDDFFAWDPTRLTLAPPAEDVRIRIADGVPNAGYALRVRDADTGEVLPLLHLTLEFPGSRVPTRRLDVHDDAIFLGHVPLDRRIAWRVDCDGHAPAVGGQAAFEIVEQRGASEVRVCELELHAGWGEYFQFLDVRNRNALVGARVLLDGREAGTTDVRGCVLVRAREKPSSIELLRAGAAEPQRVGAGKRNGRPLEVVLAAPPRQPQKKTPKPGKH